MLSEKELQQYSPWLVSVACSGSSVLPWISNPRDHDYIFYVTDNTLGEKILDLLEHKPKNECWLFDIVNRPTTPRIFEYQTQFRVLVYGTYQPSMNILEIPEKYKYTLVKTALGVPYTPNQKMWYHILTGIYMLENNSYELTSEQENNIRICHDREMSLELYDWIQHQLQQFASELQEECLDEN